MQIANTLGPGVHRLPAPGRTFRRGWARRMLLAFALVSLTLGLVRLRAGDFTMEAAQAVVRLWYLEALAFCAVFGGGALIGGLFTRHRRMASRRRRARNPLSAAYLAGVERRAR